MSRTADTIPRPYHARIVDIDDVTTDTRILRVELDNKQRIAYAAGQYALLGAAGLDVRPFSIASAPQDPLIEFHIRSSGYGLSAWLVGDAKPGAAVTVEAPYGQSYWRSSDRPVLALAGGLGIAPLKAILETHLAQAGSPPCHLYWGVRDDTQLYLDRHFQTLARKYPRFSYIPVLSEATGDGRLRSGFVSAAVAEDFTTLDGFDIYLAGPPPMVAATLPALLHHGADKHHIFSDAWSPDSKDGGA